MNRSSTRAFLSLPLLSLLAACSSGGASNDVDGPVGEARVAIATVPSDVGCARITAAADRTVSQDFAVTPGASAHLVLPNVPAGTVQFSATAFRDACPVATNAVPTWITTTPTTLNVTSGTAVDVTINLVQNATGNVTLNFGDGGSPTPPACTSTTTTTAHAVTNAITIPTQRADSAVDLDGNGFADNQYGSLTGAMIAQGLDSQLPMSNAISAGTGILMFDETSSDATLTTDPSCASTKLFDAVNHPAPDFSGNGHFSADPTVPAALLSGGIQASTFETRTPAAGAAPPVTSVLLPFAGVMVKLPLTVLHISLTNSGGGITKGQLNGIIKANDVQTIVIPAIATGLNASVQANPSSSTSKAIVTLFDKGNCSNNGTPALVDGVISTCEVAGSTLLGNLLIPDVRIFDANGSSAPSATATPKDGFSVGFRFTTVKAVP